jgi:hypothetical protein
VTRTAPLARAQASRTWSGLACSRAAISYTGLSTGPSLCRVSGLRDRTVAFAVEEDPGWREVPSGGAKRGERGRALELERARSEKRVGGERRGDVRERAVGLDDDVVRLAELDERRLADVDVGVQEDLREARRVICSSSAEWKRRRGRRKWASTWFAAGLTLAEASRTVRSATSKLLTPMLLRRRVRRGVGVGGRRGRVLGEPVRFDLLHLGPGGGDVRLRQARVMDEVEVDVLDPELSVLMLEGISMTLGAG